MPRSRSSDTGANPFEEDLALEGAGEEKPCASPDSQDGDATLAEELLKAAAPIPPTEDQKRFRALVKRWKEDTGHLSSAVRMAKHPSYREIIQMGSAAIPLLLAELKRDPDFWFAALREITQENPVPARSAGKVKDMAQAWIEWGRKQGYIQ